MSTVYVIQQQLKYDQASRELVPRFGSIELAEKWGEIVYVLSPSANPFNLELVLGDMHSSLRNYSDDDCLLLIGNPALIGMATAIAAYYNKGKIRMLQWSGQHKQYTEISGEIY